MHVAIVGGSLAGAYLAYLLGGGADSVSIFDPRAPWEKPCGGGLYGDTLRRHPVLREVCTWNYPIRWRWVSSRGEMRFATKGQSAIASRVDINRGLLGLALKHSNVRFMPEQVRGLEKVGARWRVQAGSEPPTEADVVIGADGVNSVVRRTLLGRLPREHLGVTLGYWVKACPVDEMIVQTYRDLLGYAWYFPRSDHANVGIGTCSIGADIPDLWRRLDAFLQAQCPQAQKVGKWGAGIPAVSDGAFWNMPCAGPNWALIGDAAGHVHTLLGEGMSYALDDAHLVAQAIAQGDVKAYDRAWRKKNGGWLRQSSEALGFVLESGCLSDYEVAAFLAQSGSTWLARLYAGIRAASRRLAGRRPKGDASAC
jgi:flavin-dependent dehydrogenase